MRSFERIYDAEVPFQGIHADQGVECGGGHQDEYTR